MIAIRYGVRELLGTLPLLDKLFGTKLVLFEDALSRDEYGWYVDGLNSRFRSMHAAFKAIDLDRSGTISRDEMCRALQMWNIPVTGVLDVLMDDIDRTMAPIRSAHSAPPPRKMKQI